MGGQNNLQLSDAFVYALLIAILIFGMQYFYEHNTALCNDIIMTLDKWLIYPFSFIPDSNAEKVIKGFQWDEPENYDWDQMVTLTAIMGTYWRWILSPIMLYMTWVAFSRSSIAIMYQRSFSMRSLIKNNVTAFPCMAPVANIDILKLPLHEGAWRLVLSPLQFAVQHGLIVDREGKIVDESLLLNKRTRMANDMSPLLAKNGNDGVHLDIPKTVTVLSRQLGPAFESIEALPDHIKGLAAAFMAFGVGNKQAGQGMLDYMSLSYKNDEKGNPISVSIDGIHYKDKREEGNHALNNAQDLLARYANDTRVLEATQHHTAYVSTWLISLLIFARSKGVIACSQFIWLRPMDRPMFYALDQVGGRRPWAESIASWVQYDYERMARQPVYEIFMESAAMDLAVEIADLGFIDEKSIIRKN